MKRVAGFRSSNPFVGCRVGVLVVMPSAGDSTHLCVRPRVGALVCGGRCTVLWCLCVRPRVGALVCGGRGTVLWCLCVRPRVGALVVWDLQLPCWGRVSNPSPGRYPLCEASNSGRHPCFGVSEAWFGDWVEMVVLGDDRCLAPSQESSDSCWQQWCFACLDSQRTWQQK